MKYSHEIDGWFNYAGVYDFLIDQCPASGVFIECGAWLGKSSSYLIDKALNKNIDVTIIDSWKGSINELQTTQNIATQMDIYEVFLNNMGNRKYESMKALSYEASLHFDNESCDVVFIDMEHTYNAVKNDIELWLPKVKTGGYLAGHDYSNDWLGVIQAVDEKLGKDNIRIQDTCWIYKKESL
jgi:hypothetical protein